MCPSRSRKWPIRDDNGPHSTFIGVRSKHCMFLSQCASIDALTLLKMGQSHCTALWKPNGKIRGIVIGDIMRQLVARTIDQQVILTVEEATAPFQCVLSTKSGGECVAHTIQSLTELDPRATILSVDGIGAFDLIARATTLDSLLNVDGATLCPAFRPSEPSQYLWERHWRHSSHRSKARAVSRATR